jgi:pyruvate formate lyase activating enzyme
MKEALYYKRLKDKIVRCELCPRGCVIKENRYGNCGVRQNKKGKLYSLVYGKPCSRAIDPIEKKPLFHFLPGSMSYSIATVGCNFHCLFCQNYTISQAKPDEIPSMNLQSEEVVKEAIKNNCKSIAYTYTEPTIFYEYMIDIAKIAKKKGLKNVIVSNGFINEEPLKELCKYIDAANIDLKGNDRFYKEMTGGGFLKPILKNLKILKENNVWLEITNLIIPGYNDNEKEIKKICLWIKENLGEEVPLHFSRFFPYYRLTDIKPTPQETLEKVKKTAEKIGLKYVYIGNISVDKAENTYCPKCKRLLVERHGFGVLRNEIKNDKCSGGTKIAGIWD